MKNLLKCLLAFTSLIFLAGCSNDDKDENVNQPQKRITRYFSFSPPSTSKDEKWVYNYKERLIEVVDDKTKTVFIYDENERVTKAIRYLTLLPEFPPDSILFHYNAGEIIIQQGSTRNKYILNDQGQPIQLLRQSPNSGEYYLQKSFTYQNGNMIKEEYDNVKIEIAYDNNKNILADYPIGVRLWASIKSPDSNFFAFTSKNNVVSRKYSIGELLSETIYQLTYDKDGYILKSESIFGSEGFVY
ncbi:hypothetical protein JET18_15120 [Chryseobacterium sp. L7]|uniref:YD repeat-containing protein n=1 Tax=Chryseobacterium endalhagicum TaxID=2797638 RepID=A0ABS1QIL3_9FLAO|nr:hypothetical protein [Chryseobacterium endalhagicum]MBL1222182.1 hypothetical protein [Chryseobacterium endalhagicum]